MSDYVEDFDRITNVGWPAGLVVLTVDELANANWTVAFIGAEGVGSVAGEAFQKVLTGEVSGESVDLRNVPVTVGGLGTSTTGYPGCVRTFTGDAYSLSGSPVTATPNTAYNIRTIGVAQIFAAASSAPGATVCQLQGDHAALPGWIIGETVTASDP